MPSIRLEAGHWGLADHVSRVRLSKAVMHEAFSRELGNDTLYLGKGLGSQYTVTAFLVGLPWL